MSSRRDDDQSLGGPFNSEETVVQGQKPTAGGGSGASFVLERGVDSQGSPPLTFVAGQKHGPVSLGRGGEFRIDGPGVLVTHGYLMFDGEGIYLCSADEASPVVVEGTRLPRQWTQVSPPCSVVFGRTRAVLRPAASGAPAAPGKPVPAPPPRAKAPAPRASVRPAGVSASDSIPDDAPTPYGGVPLTASPPPQEEDDTFRPRLASHGDDESTRVAADPALMAAARAAFGDDDSTRMNNEVGSAATGQGQEMQRPAASFSPPVVVQPYVPPMPPGMVREAPPGVPPPGYGPSPQGYPPQQAPYGAPPPQGYPPPGYPPQQPYGAPPPGHPPQQPYGAAPQGYPPGYPPPAGAYLPQVPGYPAQPGAYPAAPGAPTRVSPAGFAGPGGGLPDATAPGTKAKKKASLPPAVQRAMAWFRAGVAPGSPKRAPLLVAGCSLVAIFVATLVTVIRLHASSAASTLPPSQMPVPLPTPSTAPATTAVSPGIVVYPAPPRPEGAAGYDAGPKPPRGKPAPAPPPTLERTAVDAINRGDYLGALTIYKQLAKEQPDNPAFANAVRLIQQKLGAAPDAP